ncbi:MAG: hypothetical protein QNJ98_19335 [Planctomycetota bacterium]|nr:hypothetical protein [Planctomycetota bacterium]
MRYLIAIALAALSVAPAAHAGEANRRGISSTKSRAGIILSPQSRGRVQGLKLGDKGDKMQLRHRGPRTAKSKPQVVNGTFPSRGVKKQQSENLIDPWPIHRLKLPETGAKGYLYGIGAVKPRSQNAKRSQLLDHGPRTVKRPGPTKLGDKGSRVIKYQDGTDLLVRK